MARAILRAFISSPTDAMNRLEDELQEFERCMLERCESKVKASADAAKFLHTDVAILEGNCTRGAAAAKVVHTSSS